MQTNVLGGNEPTILVFATADKYAIRNLTQRKFKTCLKKKTLNKK